MAKRPSVQEILERARQGGPAKPPSEAEPAAAPQPVNEVVAEAAASTPRQPAPHRPPRPRPPRQCSHAVDSGTSADTQREAGGGAGWRSGHCGPATAPAAPAAPVQEAVAAPAEVDAPVAAAQARRGTATGQAAGPADDTCRRSWRRHVVPLRLRPPRHHQAGCGQGSSRHGRQGRRRRTHAASAREDHRSPRPGRGASPDRRQEDQGDGGQEPHPPRRQSRPPPPRLHRPSLRPHSPSRPRQPPHRPRQAARIAAAS